MDEIIKVYEDAHIDPPWSHLAAFAFEVLLLGTLWFCVREILRARRLSREAEGSLVPGVPLFDGARVVSGNVALAQGEETALQVTIWQDGSEHKNKNGYTHHWEETARETVARPFYLVHESGTRIRVEPPPGVVLVDKLDQKEWLFTATRRLRAELVPGERAIVEGVLRRAPDPEAAGANVGYRDAAMRGWVLKPGPKGMFVSTEDLARRHLLRARAFVWTIPLVVVLGALAHLPLSTYGMRVFLGRSVAAEYGGKSSYQTRSSKGSITTHYVVRASYEDETGNRHIDTLELDYDDYNELPLAGGGHLWVRYVPGHPEATACGRGSSVAAFMWFISMVIMGVGIWRVGVAHYYRRWYEGRVVEKGNGRLPPPSGQRFVLDQPGAREARSARAIDKG